MPEFLDVQHKYLSVTTATESSVDFGSYHGAVSIRNKGPASVHVALDATATGSDADGNILLEVGEPLNLPNVRFKTVSVYALTDGASARVDIVATKGAQV